MHRNARSMPWVSKEALDLRRTSKPSSPSKEPDSRVFRGYCGAKESSNPGPSHIKPKTHAEEEEMSEDERKGLNCQETLPKTILFSANRDHGRREQQATKGSLPERPKGKHKCNEIAIGE